MSGAGRWPRRARSAIAFLGLAAAWEVATRALPQRPVVFPPPSTILATLADNSALFFSAMQPTVLEAAAGLAISCVLSVLFAAVFVRSKALEDSLYNVAVFMHGIPLIAIMPILNIWLGTGYAPKIAVAALASFFPLLVNTTRGLQSVDEQMLEFLRVLDAGWWQTLRTVRWPSALPFLFAALKIGAPAAVLGATVGEWIGSQTGLGYRILAAMFSFDPPMLWATMVVSASVALAGFGFFAQLERMTIGRWADASAVRR